jgi:uncharacterized protein YbbC (DUF1343 family)
MYDVMVGAKLALNQGNHSTKVLVLDRPNPLNGNEGITFTFSQAK